jgi:hypothetical protein
MSSALIQYIIPDLLSLYPFEFPKANTYSQEYSAERRVWVSGFDIFNEKQSAISEKAQSLGFSVPSHTFIQAVMN